MVIGPFQVQKNTATGWSNSHDPPSNPARVWADPLFHSKEKIHIAFPPKSLRLGWPLPEIKPRLLPSLQTMLPPKGGISVRFRSSLKCSFHHSTISPVWVRSSPPQLITAWAKPCFPFLSHRMVCQNFLEANRHFPWPPRTPLLWFLLLQLPLQPF